MKTNDRIEDEYAKANLEAQRGQKMVMKKTIAVTAQPEGAGHAFVTHSSLSVIAISHICSSDPSCLTSFMCTINTHVEDGRCTSPECVSHEGAY